MPDIFEDPHFLEWFNQRPPAIQEFIRKLPPDRYYSLHGKQCHIVSYHETDGSAPFTVTVHKTGVGGPMAAMGLGAFDQNQVFGVKLEDLQEWKDEHENKETDRT